jgi:NAD(P)-dependent dehydrogenase (short-subunit alcohol dehydrogenase family)
MSPDQLRRFLAGRRLAVVTGAAGGIGAACVAKLVAKRYSVLGLDLDLAETIGSDDQSAENGPSAPVVLTGDSIVLRCDISNAEEVRSVAEALEQAELTIDTVVNVAGISPPGDLLESSDESWDRTFAVNVGGIRNTTRAFAPLMSTPASIVNVASGAGLRAIPGLAAYVASKHAVVGLTRAMAVDFADRSIRVNCVCPGQVDTELARQVQERRNSKVRERAASLSDYLIPRIAEPAEIAEPICFLASDAASYITGSTVSVDAGRTQH